MAKAVRDQVLITRPQAGADETAARVAAMGLTPIVAPVLRVRSLSPRLPAAIDAILVTSRNALAAIPDRLHGVPLLAVGDATAAEARRLGFVDVRSADGNAKALAAMVASAIPDEARSHLLHVAGRGVGQELAVQIRAAGRRMTRRVGYEQIPERTLPIAARESLQSGRLRAGMFFSAQTARVFVRLVTRSALASAVRDVEACAIGAPAAVALGALPWRGIRIAARPNQDAMLALLR